MTRALLALLLLLLPTTAVAQAPVVQWADWASWGTALVNPAVAVVQAARGERPLCHLGQLAITATVVNVATVTIKHFVVSPRPCMGFGCQPDGSPSGHSANATIGVSRWKYGLMFSVGTMQLRRDANRHTFAQVVQGLGVGLAGEAAGHLLRCGD